ncbi:Hypothetical predicted protein [Lecanosticta acicola]|uniref:Uncharacterized protein n=1 Tax=Lecanosticta acicola TaxID=111012 RepID=A0AAI8YRW6_9PEZI|nr:Hypothetical predicted protein [Lecanosticta acicola]
MDRATSYDLMATGRRVTRLQVRKLLRTFAFLELPPELRNMIYELALGDPARIKTIFNRYYASLVRETVKAPLLRKKAPTILLLNKQIYDEAVGILQTRSIIFNHGLLRIPSVKLVISPHLLCQVASLEINDKGHRIIKTGIIQDSWYGYMTLLQQLGKILSAGHKLKSLTIDFGDKRLEEHMTACYHASYDCSFRDGMRGSANAFWDVRGIEKVVIKGLNATHAAQLKARMESTPTGFMNLPREIRDMIYEDALDWSDVTTALVRSMANWANKEKPFPYPRRTTPTVLLINRQIASEARQVLVKKPLHISFPGDHSITQEKHIPNILHFISPATLQQVRALHLDFESWEWIFNINRRFVGALAASAKLETFRLSYRDSLKGSFLALPNQRYPDTKLNAYLKQLAQLRGLKTVVFEGDLPVCYTDALTAIMTSTPRAGEVLPALMAIRGDGSMVGVGHRDDEEATYGHPSSSSSSSSSFSSPA